MARPGRLLGEAARVARAQWVATTVCALLVGLQCVVVLLTSGRAAQAEEQVLDTIDERGTRTLVVSTPVDSPLRADFLDTLVSAPAVAEALGLGPVSDSFNTAVPGGPAVPLRRGYGTVGGLDLVSGEPSQQAWLSSYAAQSYGLFDGSGSVTSVASDTEHPALRILDDAAHLQQFEPLALLPTSTSESIAGDDAAAPVTQVIVLAEQPSDVAALEALVRAMLRDAEASQITIETSAELAQVRAAVSGELGRYGRRTILAVLGTGLVVITLSLLALTAMRRGEFGRRRALGATRSHIMSLVLGHTVIASGLGALGGVLGSLGWLTIAEQPRPPSDFIAAVVVLVMICALLAAMTPAIIAARRDPLRELRVP